MHIPFVSIQLSLFNDNTKCGDLFSYNTNYGDLFNYNTNCCVASIPYFLL